jgi:hypothetical protein
MSILDGAQLLAYHGGIVEVRILRTRKGTVSGYFSDPATLAHAVELWDGKANVYVTANPVNPVLLARATNRLQEFAKATTGDTDIVRRAWFLADFDPVRPSGISSTDEELAHALARRDEAVAFLTPFGFPPPVTAMSGNGGHADWIGDFPNDAATTTLFERALKALASKFSDNTVTCDETVFNPARIWRLYGTVAVKGDATTERPHRRATIERLGPMQPLLRESIEALARLAPEPKRTYSAPRGGSRTPLDPIGAFTARGGYLRALGNGKHAVICPWVTEHSGDSGMTETCLFEPQGDDGPWGFDCKHAHCASRTIKDVIGRLELSANGHQRASVEDNPAHELLREGLDLAMVWPDGVRFALTAIRDDRDGVRGELTVSQGGRRLSWGVHALSSIAARETLRKKLESTEPGLPWGAYLEEALWQFTHVVREGEPLVTLTGKITPPSAALLPAMLYPGEPTQVYADGDTGKSLLATGLAVAMASGTEFPCGLLDP